MVSNDADECLWELKRLMVESDYQSRVSIVWVGQKVNASYDGDAERSRMLGFLGKS